MKMTQYSLKIDTFLKCNALDTFQKDPQKFPWDCTTKYHLLVAVGELSNASFVLVFPTSLL